MWDNLTHTDTHSQTYSYGVYARQEMHGYIPNVATLCT